VLDPAVGASPGGAGNGGKAAAADADARRSGAAAAGAAPGAAPTVPLSEAPALDVTAKPRRWKWLARLRDVLLRLWSRFFSRRPHVSAREVLAKMRARGLL
jgi:hypothetical protein